MARVDRFASAEEFRDYFKERYGPTVVAYRGLVGTRTGPQPWTGTWPTWPAGTVRTPARWSGST